MDKIFMAISLFLMYSFLGWIMESIYCMIIDKKFVNRGFMIGPVCPIYGVGCLLILIFLQKYKNDPASLFCMAVLVCSVLEYFTSYIMEKIFKTRWWDYSQKKFSLNGRICLDISIAFGVLGLLLTYIINPFMLDILYMIDINLLKILTSFFFIIFLVDLGISAKIIYNVKSVDVSSLKDQTEEMSEKVKEVLKSKGILTRRVANAFPNFKVKYKSKK